MDKSYMEEQKCPQIENLAKITPEQAAITQITMTMETINDFCSARIRKPADGGIPYIEIKRAKFKHWHIIGFHYDSDQAFKRALAVGTVVWLPKIIEPPPLFEK